MISCMAQTITADTEILGFCGRSASVPRGFVSVELGATARNSWCDNTTAVVDSGKAAPLIGDACDSLPHV